MPTPQHITVPDDRFLHVHLDIIGPLPLSRDKRYCLTMIDRTTRWPEAVLMADTSAHTIAAHFVETWISRFGIPEIITTDRGTVRIYSLRNTTIRCATKPNYSISSTIQWNHREMAQIPQDSH